MIRNHSLRQCDLLGQKLKNGGNATAIPLRCICTDGRATPLEIWRFNGAPFNCPNKRWRMLLWKIIFPAGIKSTLKQRRGTFPNVASWQIKRQDPRPLLTCIRMLFWNTLFHLDINIVLELFSCNWKTPNTNSHLLRFK